MDDLQAPLQVLRLRDRAVRDPRAHDDQKIAVGDSPVRIRLSVVPQHAEIQRVRLRQDTDAHHGMDQRDLELFAEFPDHRLAVAQDHAAACDQQRLLCLVDRRDDLGHLLRVSLGIRTVSADIYLLRIHKLLPQLCHLDIPRNIDQHRALTACGGDVEGFLEDPRDIVRVLHQIAVFHEGLRGAAHVRLLEHILAQEMRIHLSGDGDDRDTVGISRGQCCDEVRRAGSGRSHAYGSPAADAGVPAGLVACVLFLSRKNMLDPAAVVQRVVKRGDRNPRITEDPGDSLRFKTFHHCLGTIHK